VSPYEVDAFVLVRTVSRPFRRIITTLVGLSLLAVLVPVVAMGESDPTPAAAIMVAPELEMPVHAHPATGDPMPEPPPPPPFPEWELHAFEAGQKPAGFDPDVAAAEAQPVRRAVEPPADPEPAEGECPPNSSPDCAFTYRVPLETWERVASCESNNRWHISTGNGYHGGLQFSVSSWQWVGGTGYPHEHSKWVQIHFAERLLDRQGWVAWPACSRKLGLS